MHNICLVFTRVVDAQHKEYCWTQTECHIIQECFYAYELLDTKDVIQYGATTNIVRTLEKVLTQIMNLRVKYEQQPVNVVSLDGLNQVLNSCLIWLYNASIEKETKKEVAKQGVFKLTRLIFDE